MAGSLWDQVSGSGWTSWRQGQQAPWVAYGTESRTTYCHAGERRLDSLTTDVDQWQEGWRLRA